MFLLMRDDCVFGAFPPLCRSCDLDFKIESVTANQSLQLGRLHSVVIRHRVRECLQKPLVFGTGLGHGSSHNRKYRSR